VVCRGLLDTGANVVTLRLWGSRAEPFVQSLHASFAVGALVAPLLAERFISQGQHSGGVAAACRGDGAGATPSVWLEGMGDTEAVADQEEDVVEVVEGNVKWAFWISSAIMIPSALGLTALTPRYARICRIGAQAAEAAKAADGANTPPRKRPPGYQNRVLGLGLCIFGLYVGAEIGYGAENAFFLQPF
jgi:fucose permease